MISSASTRPIWCGHHRAVEKNRCARARPAPVSIPHTVRATGWVSNPATSAVNTSTLGAVKHSRNGASTRQNVRGRVTPWSIGGTLFRHRRSCYRKRRCSTHTPIVINTTRRHTPSDTVTTTAITTTPAHEKCESRGAHQFYRNRARERLWRG